MNHRICKMFKGIVIFLAIFVLLTGCVSVNPENMTKENSYWKSRLYS